MKHIKKILATVLAVATLCLAACTGDGASVDTIGDTLATQDTQGETQNQETAGSDVEVESPSQSIDLLTFTPASPKGQVLTEDGKSPQILITNYNETATDALGRVLPTSDEVGLPKEGKYIGLFYSLWTVGSACEGDNAKAMAQNPYNPNFGARWQFCWWAEPETGYHRADDVWQIKRDMYYFAMAGVDFLYFDMTNGYLYADAMEVFLDTCLAMRAEGQMTPYIVPWCFGTAIEGNGDTGAFYHQFMTQEKYKDLWFHWEGKPLAMIKPIDDGSFPILEDEYFADKLTFRKAWVSPGKESKLYWEDNRIVNFGYGYGYVERRRFAECTGIGCAGFANFGAGRSGALSAKDNLNAFWETDTMGQGLVFEDAFNQLMTKNPECQVLLISRWNEWVAQNFTHPDDRGTDTGFVDQFNPEFSRDIEPMKGGFTDNYFYQMCSIIRRFKGVLPADGASGKNTMTETDADVFEKWENIAPVYTDFVGDTSHRDHSDTTGRIQYVNTTGRNDIVESRITADGAHVYVYARAAQKLTSYQTSPHWMLLFIDADADKTTGWEGYDYLINYQVISDTVTTLCAYKDGVWQEIGTVAYATKDDRLTVTIPRSLLGLTGDSVKVNFHWMDNVTDIYSLESWFTTGDSVPERRNNYMADLPIAYTGDGERILPARESNTIDGMPGLSFSDEFVATMKTGLKASFYLLPENYPAQPDFRLIDALYSGAESADGLTKDVLPRSNDIAVVYEGYIKVAKTDNYEFELSYGDGAKLFIDGRLVVDGSYDPKAQDGVKTAKGSIILSGGYHAIRVEYVECKGGDPLLSLKGNWEFYVSEFEEDILIFPAWEVDFSTMKDQEGYWDDTGAGIYEPYMYLQPGYNVYLGKVDLSQYTYVEIVYCCDGSDITKDRFEMASSLAIGLKSEDSTYGQATTDNFSGDIAHTNMVFSNRSWATGARSAYVDLADIDYNGEVWMALHNPVGTFIAVLEIKFYDKGTVPEDTTTPSTPTPKPDPTPTPKPDPNADVYEFPLSVIETLDGGPGYNSNTDGFGVRIDAQNGSTLFELGEVDLSQYARVEITYGSDGGAKLGDEGCFFALSTNGETVKDANRGDVLGWASAENATASWTGDRTAVIDLSDVDHNGTVYLTFFMGHVNGISIYSIKFCK